MASQAKMPSSLLLLTTEVKSILFSKTDLRSKWSLNAMLQDVVSKQRWCFQWCENLYGISCSSRESLGGLTALTLSMPEMWYSEDRVKLLHYQKENNRKKGPLLFFFKVHEKFTIQIMSDFLQRSQSSKLYRYGNM